MGSSDFFAASACVIQRAAPGHDAQAASLLVEAARAWALASWKAELASTQAPLAQAAAAPKPLPGTQSSLRIATKRRSALTSESKAVLEEWLAQHVRLPYPTEEEKAVLAAEAGIRKEQVTNWFINARGRNTWKDLVKKQGLETFRDERGRWHAV